MDRILDLTENFKLDEFECKCGCVMPDEAYVNVRFLADQLERHFRSLGPISIESGYRCEDHNAKKSTGGGSKSKHLTGMAADIKILKMPGVFYSAEFLKGWAEAKIADGKLTEGGLGTYGKYPNLLHYDFRGMRARWHYL